VEALNVMCTADNVGELLSGNPDFVLDAIDNIDTKVALLAAAKERGIPVLCVAGAGAKADPTRLRVVDVSESSIDPLARAVRQK
jgi:tRNA A37 threonylcarbamoyladenosine dehydratase